MSLLLASLLLTQGKEENCNLYLQALSDGKLAMNSPSLVRMHIANWDADVPTCI